MLMEMLLLLWRWTAAKFVALTPDSWNVKNMERFMILRVILHSITEVGNYSSC